MTGDQVIFNLFNSYVQVIPVSNTTPFYQFTYPHSFTKNWLYANDNTNVYHHVNVIHDYFIDTHNYTAMNYQMEAEVDCGSGVNGASNGIEIWFGSQGGYQWAKSSDVIYHEYTHCTIYHLYGNSWIGSGYYTQGSAMDEGFADYYACTLNDDPTEGESCNVNRILNNDYTYLENWNLIPGFEPGAHSNGMIISGCIWDMREDASIGVELADALLFGALEYADADEFSMLLDNVVYADDDDGNPSNGSPHLNAILQAFYNHTVYPADPTIPPLPPQNLYYELDGSNHPVLNWDANIEDDIDQYKVYRKFHNLFGDPYTWECIATVNHPTTQHTDLEVTYSPNAPRGSGAYYYVTAVDNVGSESSGSNMINFKTYTPAGDNQQGIAVIAPSAFSISAAPNPFNNQTALKLGIPEASFVEIKLYDITGKEVADIYQGFIPAGIQQFTFDAGQLSSGIYLCRASAGKDVSVVKLMLVK